MLENQRLMNEAMTDTGDIAQFKRISIPLVRRIYPQLIANKIVSRSAASRPDRSGLLPALPLLVEQGCDERGRPQQRLPIDDATSLQQLASGDGNLDIYYTHQFVQNETSSTDRVATRPQSTLLWSTRQFSLAP
jgi:hypothetical protein